jgi:hypothetical protein
VQGAKVTWRMVKSKSRALSFRKAARWSWPLRASNFEKKYWIFDGWGSVLWSVVLVRAWKHRGFHFNFFLGWLSIGHVDEIK